VASSRTTVTPSNLPPNPRTSKKSDSSILPSCTEYIRRLSGAATPMFRSNTQWSRSKSKLPVMAELLRQELTDVRHIIPIAHAPLCRRTTSRYFVPWCFLDAVPSSARWDSQSPASKNLHISGLMHCSAVTYLITSSAVASRVDGRATVSDQAPFDGCSMYHSYQRRVWRPLLPALARLACRFYRYSVHRDFRASPIVRAGRYSNLEQFARSEASLPC
jgi:hypothetical protein